MIVNLVLMKEDEDISILSKELGFSRTLFLEKDFQLITGKTKKELLKKIKEAKRRNLLAIVKPEREELLRFVLEKTTADLVFDQELINKKDSLLFRRGGLDQILCKIAKEKEKIIGFNFRNILILKEEREKILGRMIFNLKLCRKYQTKIFLGNFSREKWEIRSSQELRAFLEVLGGGWLGKRALELNN